MRHRPFLVSAIVSVLEQERDDDDQGEWRAEKLEKQEMHPIMSFRATGRGQTPRKNRYLIKVLAPSGPSGSARYDRRYVPALPLGQGGAVLGHWSQRHWRRPSVGQIASPLIQIKDPIARVGYERSSMSVRPDREGRVGEA